MSRKDLGVCESPHGLLNACLVDGDPGQLVRARRSRSKALALSLAIQASALAALLLIPLLATGEKLSFVALTPVVPHYGVLHREQPRLHETRNSHPLTVHNIFSFAQPSHIPERTATHDAGPPCCAGDGPPAIGEGIGPGVPLIVEDFGSHGPTAPIPSEPVKKPRIVHVSRMNPAMLIRRVEPAYPILATMAHREGRVELRAIISTDGSIRALEVISGDPLFIRASFDAVYQWRYRPLILNGQAVEVETHITVIFQLQR